MALSNVKDNIKMFSNQAGEFIPLLIRWNKSTRSWHVHVNSGTLHLKRATITPTRGGYLMLDKTWEYDVTHPERIAFYREPVTKATRHTHLTAALLRFALTA